MKDRTLEVGTLVTQVEKVTNQGMERVAKVWRCCPSQSNAVLQSQGKKLRKKTKKPVSPKDKWKLKSEE